MMTALQRGKAIVKLLVKLLPLQPSKSDQQLMFVASTLEKVIQLVLEIEWCDKNDECHEQGGK